MAARTLKAVRWRFLEETEQLLRWFQSQAPPGTTACDAVHRSSREMTVIRLHDSWARFCRELILISAYARPRTETGQTVQRAPGIRSRQDVVTSWQSTFPRSQRPRYEPHWATASDALGLAQRVQLGNFLTVSAALSSNTSPAEPLRRMRNFFAHRGHGTALFLPAVMSRHGVSRVSPDQFLGHLVPPGVSVFEHWVLSLRVIAADACL
jgi:hypothetical protein